MFTFLILHNRDLFILDTYFEALRKSISIYFYFTFSIEPDITLKKKLTYKYFFLFVITPDWPEYQVIDRKVI